MEFESTYTGGMLDEEYHGAQLPSQHSPKLFICGRFLALEFMKRLSPDHREVDLFGLVQRIWWEMTGGYDACLLVGAQYPAFAVLEDEVDGLAGTLKKAGHVTEGGVVRGNGMLYPKLRKRMLLLNLRMFDVLLYVRWCLAGVVEMDRTESTFVDELAAPDYGAFTRNPSTAQRLVRLDAARAVILGSKGPPPRQVPPGGYP